VKNKLHIPKSDGCGSLGMTIDTEYLPSAEMGNCCNLHDLCYDTCNSDKELCDLDFKRCLYKYCDTFEKSAAGDLLIKGCKAAAKMLFSSTMTLGCKSYLDSQEKACFCPVNGAQNQGKYEKEKYSKKKDKKSNWRTEM
jgi:secretory phospholipase A2